MDRCRDVPAAEQQFRRVIGYSDLSKLVIAIERRHLTLESPNTMQRSEGDYRHRHPRGRRSASPVFRVTRR
jgi:hypothetical protein